MELEVQHLHSNKKFEYHHRWKALSPMCVMSFVARVDYVTGDVIRGGIAQKLHISSENFGVFLPKIYYKGSFCYSSTCTTANSSLIG